METKTTIQDALSELQPISSYLAELHNQKEAISVVREFLEGRIAIEKNLETKEVLKIVYKRLAEPEDKLGKMVQTLYADMEMVCVNYAGSIINVFIDQLNEEIKNLYKEKEVKNYENR
jgi:hypothetical protein